MSVNQEQIEACLNCPLFRDAYYTADVDARRLQEVNGNLEALEEESNFRELSWQIENEAARDSILPYVDAIEMFHDSNPDMLKRAGSLLSNTMDSIEADQDKIRGYTEEKREIHADQIAGLEESIEVRSAFVEKVPGCKGPNRILRAFGTLACRAEMPGDVKAGMREIHKETQKKNAELGIPKERWDYL